MKRVSDLSCEKCEVVADAVSGERISTFWSYSEEKSAMRGGQLGMKDGRQTSIREDESASMRVRTKKFTLLCRRDTERFPADKEDSESSEVSVFLFK